MRNRLLAFGCLLALTSPTWAAEEQPSFERTRDVIYGRKFGLALTMDVFTPRKPNGKALIFVVSGGWFSSPQNINLGFAAPFLKRGYTVFAVVHGSQPKFTIPEIMEDMHRAVRFVRASARRFKIDPDAIGIYGGSAGGHLSLMMGTASKEGDPAARDEVDRVSSRVQAVACFFPPTDFLNFGKPGKEMLSRSLQAPFTAAVDFHEFDKQKARFLPIEDENRQRQIMKEISPAQLVTADDAPSLLIHGDKDELVPLQQSELIVEKFKTARVPVELIVRKGAGHGWLTIPMDLEKFADWFDKYLKPEKGS